MWSLSKQGTTLRRPRSINIAAAENNPNRLGYIQPWYNVSPGNGAPVAVVLNDMRVDKHQDSKSATHDASRTAGLKTIKCVATRKPGSEMLISRVLPLCRFCTATSCSLPDLNAERTTNMEVGPCVVRGRMAIA